MKILYLIFRQILISKGLDPAKKIVVKVVSMYQIVIVADNTDFTDNINFNS